MCRATISACLDRASAPSGASPRRLARATGFVSPSGASGSTTTWAASGRGGPKNARGGARIRHAAGRAGRVRAPAQRADAAGRRGGGSHLSGLRLARARPQTPTGSGEAATKTSNGGCAPPWTTSGRYHSTRSTARIADDFVDPSSREREAIDEAAAAGAPLTEEYRDPRTGRITGVGAAACPTARSTRCSQPCAMVLKEAKRHGYIEHNPLDDPDCFLRTEHPGARSWSWPRSRRYSTRPRLLDQEQRRLEWRDVYAIRESAEPATALAGRYGVSETMIRRIAETRFGSTAAPARRRGSRRCNARCSAGPRIRSFASSTVPRRPGGAQDPDAPSQDRRLRAQPCRWCRRCTRPACRQGRA